MDIIVTTPKSEMANAAKEAQDALAGKVDLYFRSMSKVPINLKVGNKVFYVEDGFITGYAIVDAIRDDYTVKCETTGWQWEEGVIFMRCDSWKWIKPIPMKGFQGFRYMKHPIYSAWKTPLEVIGDWKDPKPGTNG